MWRIGIWGKWPEIEEDPPPHFLQPHSGGTTTTTVNNWRRWICHHTWSFHLKQVIMVNITKLGHADREMRDEPLQNWLAIGVRLGAICSSPGGCCCCCW